ncbi:NAD-dependent epimerase/dehydratase family protein [Lachnospiraceae bacterium]|nr:NAD-dependent epimerase/dehydratase family protein [Lachnospiraceae bacterium]
MYFILDHKLYKEDLHSAAALDLPWKKLENKSVLITGAGGLVGSFVIDLLMYKNLYEGLKCRIYAMGRNQKKAEMRFQSYWQETSFQFIAHDINKPLALEVKGDLGYVLHLASNTHPLAYSCDPIGTIAANIIGTNNLLDFAVKNHAERFAFASSNEIYGENRGDTEFFREDYCGYLDCNTLRAGYPESKRCGEALCQAYKKQYCLDIVIPRLTRTYGPTMLMNDTKAVSQFLKKALAKEDIILKSTGTQYYSYTYVADAVSGLLTVLLKGQNGEAYNIAENTSDIRLKDLAAAVAENVGKKVVFELPDEMEKAGYSTATKARLDGGKLQKLGWRSRYDIKNGITRTLSILKDSITDTF